MDPIVSEPALAGLPHRPPFVFVRELIQCVPGIAADCAMIFRKEDPMVGGHFPRDSRLPGVILTEALAQTAGIAAASDHPEETHAVFLLSAIRGMKFFRAVRPEERLILRAEKMAQMDDLLQFNVHAKVDGI